MKLIAILTISGAILINNDCLGQFKPINSDFQVRVCNAIFKAEGGNKATYPYGIKSIKTNNPRQICLNTIKNNYIRWQQAGKTNDFITFLGNRYCPIGAKDDKNNLNKNWIKNVNYYLKKYEN